VQRSLLIFQNCIKSQVTRDQYMYYLDRFIKFFKLKDPDSLISINQAQLQIMIEDYVMDLKRRVNPNSVPTYLYGIQTFLETNDIELNWKKIRRLYPAKIKISGAKAYTTNHIQKMLSVTPSLRNKAVIHFIAASGCRVGALPDLKLRHFSDVPLGCKSVLIYEGSLEEYTTFLTLEASKALEDYFEKRKVDGEELKPESPVFRADYKLGLMSAKPMSRRGIINMIERVVKNTGIRGFKKGNRYEIQLDHGFRKRWNTIMKTTDGMKIILAEKMFGHSTPTIPLDETYAVPSVEKLFEEYKKAIPELTVNDSERKQALLDISLKEKSELEKQIPKLVDDAVERIKQKLVSEGYSQIKN